jgi:hypothetical protein
MYRKVVMLVRVRCPDNYVTGNAKGHPAHGDTARTGTPHLPPPHMNN